MKRNKRKEWLVLAIIVGLLLPQLLVFGEEDLITKSERNADFSVTEPASVSGEVSSAERYTAGGTGAERTIAASGPSLYLFSRDTDGNVLQLPVIVDDVKMDPQPRIAAFDGLNWLFEWKITSEEMQNASAGDVFKIKLPEVDKEYITISESEREYHLIKDGRHLADYKVKDGYIRITLNEDGAEMAEIDGQIEVFLYMNKENEALRVLGKDKDITVKVEPTPKRHRLPDDWGTLPRTFGRNELIYQTVGQHYNNDNIGWFLWINERNLEKMLNDEPFEHLTNVWVESELPAEIVLDETPSAHIMFNAQVRLIMPDGKMGDGSLWGKRGVRQDYWIYDNGVETYAEFVERIKAQEPFSVGIFKRDGRTKVVTYLGDLPGNGITYHELFGGKEEFERKMLNFSRENGNVMTDIQMANTLEKHGENSRTQGQLVSLVVEIKTYQRGNPGEVTNWTKVHTDNGHEEEAVLSGTFVGVKADADYMEGVELSVQKKWQGKEVPIEIAVYRSEQGSNRKKEVRREILTAENTKGKWFYVFKGLHKKDRKGNDYIYTIEETPNHNYLKTETEVKPGVWEIVNVEKTEEIPDKPRKEERDDPKPSEETPGNPLDNPSIVHEKTPTPEKGITENELDDNNLPQGNRELPKTGGPASSLFWLSGMLIGACGCYIKGKRR